MANKYNGDVSIRLDRVRTLRFDLNAMAEYETELGENLLEELVKAARDQDSFSLSFKQVRGLLWAALLHEERNLSIWDAGNLVAAADGETYSDKLNYVTGKVIESWVVMGGPEGKKKVEEAMQAAASGTGS